MQSPVKKIYITQVFGVNPTAYAKFGLKGHNGIDYRAFLPNGERCYEGGKSEVFAPHSGIVKECAFDAGGYGNYVKIENDKEGSVLAHFSSLPLLKLGQEIKQGSFIGYQGTTGNSSGIHLHWGYYLIPRDRSNGFNGYINQEGLYQPFSESTMQEKTYTQEEWDKLRAENQDNWDKWKAETLTTAGLKEQLKLAQDKHQSLIEYIITKIAPLRAFIDQSEESAKGAIVELVSLVDTLNKTISDNKKQAEKKEQELVKKNEDLQSKLDTLQAQFDKLKEDHARELETMQNRIDKVQEQVEANSKEVAENNKFKQFIKDFITKLLKG